MTIETVAVIGAGTMGAQIGQALALAGYEVRLNDIEARILEKAGAGIGDSLQRFFVAKGKLTEEQAREVRGRLSTSTDLAEAVEGTQLVIESIIENMNVKKRLFGRLSELCPAQTILASNTSALSISDLASAATHPERVVGAHFFNPVAVMQLVELVRGARTSDETLAAVKTLAEEQLGKQTVVVNDTPGFITSRMVDVIINEAACMVAEGIASPEDIDRACKLGLGHPMGPLELADYTNGIPIVVEGMDYLRAEFGDDKYRPCYLLRQMVRAGHTGRKAGRGFYDYSPQK